MFNKQFVIAIMLCLFLFLSPFSSVASMAKSRIAPDWSDGEFHGVWNNCNDNTSGYLNGVLNQGRRSTQGTFTAEWNSSDGTTSGEIRGIFQGFLLIGQWIIAGSGGTGRFIGSIKLNDTHFTARVMSRSSGLIDITGVHNTSFLPRLTGTYGIGVKNVYLKDMSRPENFTEDPDDFREMMMQLWYPIEKNIAGDRIDYMDYPTFQWLKNRSPIPLIMIPNKAYQFVRPHGRNGTTISSGMFPIVIFSPGYDGVYQIYTSLIEDLVSHGFVVASMNHPYVSGITVFPDGRTVGLASVPTDPVARNAFFNMSLRTIVGDAKYVLDFLTEMNMSDAVFSGHFDLSRVGMYGHSFGGANTAVCCYEDSRFKAGLTLDGVFYPSFIPGDITRPFTMMVAEARFSNDTGTQYIWSHSNNDSFKVGIKGSTHYAYTDVGLLLSHLVPLIPARILGFGTIAPKRMVNITRTYETTFFEVYLMDKPVENLLNLSSQFKEVECEYKLG